MKLTQKAPLATHSVLVYGPPKTGKTQLVGGLSAKYNLIWFDLENGFSTLLKRSEADKNRIEIISLPNSRSYPIAIETCLKVIKGGLVEICEAHGKVGCSLCKQSSGLVVPVELNSLGSNTIVVFDSITELTNSAIAHITKDKPDDYKLEYADWGNLGKLMEIFFSHIQVAKFNVVCISHETETELEDGKLRIVPTAGTRNFSRTVAKYFGHVVYCQVANKKHTFNSSTTSSLNIIMGSRSGIDLGNLSEPSLIPIFEGLAHRDDLALSKTPGQIALERLKQLKSV